METQTLESALAELEQAKLAELDAKQVRIAIEEKIINMVGFTKTEGSTTIKGDIYQVTVTNKLTRDVNFDFLESQYATYPELADMVRMKPSLNLPACRTLDHLLSLEYLIKQLVLSPQKPQFLLSEYNNERH